MRRRRWIYTLILGTGLLWVVNTRPAWIDPLRLVDTPVSGPAAVEFERDEQHRVDEMNRRIKVTAVSFLAAAVVLESLAFVGRGLRRL